MPLRPAAIVLEIGKEFTVLRLRDSGEEYCRFGVGYLQLGRDHLRSEPATPAQVESAIAAIEEAIMVGMATVVRRRFDVHSAMAPLEQILATLPVPAIAPCVLTIEEVERIYCRVVNVVHGRPASVEGIAVDAAFTARLLILREFMHHTAHETIVVGA